MQEYENAPEIIGEEHEIETSDATASDSMECAVSDPTPFPSTPPVTCDTATDPIEIRTPTLSVDKFKHDAKSIHNFTGLQDYFKFMFVFASLGPAVNHLSYMYGAVPNSFSIVDRFFMVLIKLRKNFTNFDLSQFFDISEADVYNVFCTWVRFMSLQWRELNLWPNRDLVKFYAPSGFKTEYPNCRVIIDGTECPIKKPKKPTAQQATYSVYKNKNTVKVLVGISPSGMVTYVSPAFGGSASDRQIVERSDLDRLCDPGDEIMSDKGFNVQDLFAGDSVKITIPTFFKKKNRMSQKTILHDRKISSKRIHVERVIGLAKSYKILQKALNTSETMLSSDITFICFMLCNFRSCIVPTDA